MNRYRPIEAAALAEPDAHELFQLVTDHYLACADNDWERIEVIEGTPPEVKIVWRLWLFLAGVGGGGVCDHLWNHCHRLADLKQVHHDLQRVNAVSMLSLVESAIRLTLDTSYGEYLDDEGAADWSAQFTCDATTTADDLNRLSMDVAYPECSEIVAAFVRANARVF